MKEFAVAVLAFGLLTGATYAQNQDQGGLVNVATGDIGIDALNNTTVQVPIGIAAQACGVNANVIAEQRRRGGAACDAQATSDAVFTPDEDPAPQQEGLVNVNVSDVVVQLPVAVAANVCDVNVNILARQFRRGGAECDAVADAGAEA